MKPKGLRTKIFLDSGDPKETREALSLLGFLDGQTTNPSLIAKNPEAQKRLAQGKKFAKNEVLAFYKNVVKEISSFIPKGSVSIEVYADKKTSFEEMFNQGEEMFSWIPNAHIKYPIIANGLESAEKAIQEGMRVNMTLCFTQEQAAAVYAATRTKHNSLQSVFVSPFVGRLDDIGINGMDLIKNCLTMYQKSDHHVEVLAASIRTLDHFLEAIRLRCDIITAPFQVLEEWAEKGMPIPSVEFSYQQQDLQAIPYQKLNLSKPWQSFNIGHELTDKGLQKFAEDWNNLISE